MNRSSNTVTAWVRGQDAKRNSKRITFINEYADPQITVASDNQRGATGGRLAQPLEVTVKDATGKAIPSGVVVSFASAASGRMFIPVSGTTVYIAADDTLISGATAPNPNGLTTVATSSSPAPVEGPVYVQTDSSGKAKVYFQLGDTAGQQRVTITVAGSDPVEDYLNTFFRATAAAVVATDAATIAIDSGNGQSAGTDEVLDAPLVVIVKDVGGRIVAGAPVHFTTNSGALALPESGDPGVSNTTVAVDDQGSRYRVVNTDDTGKASVRYNVGDLPGAKQIFASITISGGRNREVTFGINGGRGTTTTTRPPTTTTTSRPTITLTPSSISGDAGTTRLIRATAADQNGNPVSGVLVTFSLGTASSTSFLDATVRTDSFGRADATLTLPSSSDEVFARATVDGLSVVDSTSVTVTSTAPEEVVEEVVEADTSGAPSRLTVFSGDEQIGDVNRRLDEDLIVRVLDRNGRGVESEVVRFRITDGRGRISPSSTRTDDDGFASATFTPRADGTIEVEAVSGNLSPVIFTITTGEPPDAIILVSGNNQSGRPGAALANSFIVEVIDENDDAVSGVTVAFAVTAGGGTLSATSATTNANGRAQTTSRSAIRRVITPLPHALQVSQG